MDRLAESKLDNIRNIKNATTFTSDIILTQCLLPSWGDLQPRDLHQGNKLQKPEMEGTFRLIKDWESLVLGLTSTHSRSVANVRMLT